MSTIEIRDSDKEVLNKMRRETPGAERTKESYATVVHRILETKKVE
jgi:hypothetical protein